MRIAAIYMTTGTGHVVFVDPERVQAIFPKADGTCRIYLADTMDSLVRPSDLAKKITADEGVTHILRDRIMGQVGSVLDANVSAEQACPLLGLPAFTLRAEPMNGQKVGVRAAQIIAVAPAIDPAGTAVGSNIFVRGIFLETDSRIVQVMEQVPDVLSLIEWQGRVVQVGVPYTVPAANDAKIIAPPDPKTVN